MHRKQPPTLKSFQETKLALTKEAKGIRELTEKLKKHPYLTALSKNDAKLDQLVIESKQYQTTLIEHLNRYVEIHRKIHAFLDHFMPLFSLWDMTAVNDLKKEIETIIWSPYLGNYTRGKESLFWEDLGCIEKGEVLASEKQLAARLSNKDREKSENTSINANKSLTLIWMEYIGLCHPLTRRMNTFTATMSPVVNAIKRLKEIKNSLIEKAKEAKQLEEELVRKEGASLHEAFEKKIDTKKAKTVNQEIKKYSKTLERYLRLRHEIINALHPIILKMSALDEKLLDEIQTKIIKPCIPDPPGTQKDWFKNPIFSQFHLDLTSIEHGMDMLDSEDKGARFKPKEQDEEKDEGALLSDADPGVDMKELTTLSHDFSTKHKAVIEKIKAMEAGLEPEKFAPKKP